MLSYELQNRYADRNSVICHDVSRHFKFKYIPVLRYMNKNLCHAMAEDIYKTLMDVLKDIINP